MQHHSILYVKAILFSCDILVIYLHMSLVYDSDFITRFITDKLFKFLLKTNCNITYLIEYIKAMLFTSDTHATLSLQLVYMMNS